MEAEIVPEPPEEAREALLAALAESDGEADVPAAYRSPWRLAGLPGPDDPDPWG